jgi:hypothetical protein
VTIIDWVKAQLNDPTSALHLMGIIIISGEVYHHWVSGKPVDPGTIGAGVGCFAIGGTMDHFQGKAAGV